jgi:hypothetical protein
VVLVTHQLAHVHGRGVVETLAGNAEKERVGVQPSLALRGELSERRFRLRLTPRSQAEKALEIDVDTGVIVQGGLSSTEMRLGGACERST